MTIIYKDVEGSIFRSPTDSLLAFFIMSLGEFGDFYDSFDDAIYQGMAIVGFHHALGSANHFTSSLSHDKF